MRRQPQRFWMLAVLACLLASQWHAWTDIDPCLWKPQPTHRAPIPGGHGPGGHGCQICITAGWAMASAPASLVVNLIAARLEVEPQQQFRQHLLAKVSSPRAPPHL